MVFDCALDSPFDLCPTGECEHELGAVWHDRACREAEEVPCLWDLDFAPADTFGFAPLFAA